MHQQKVRRHTGLPGAEQFAPGDAPAGGVQVCGFIDDTGAFAAELQYHRRQMLRSGSHNLAADGSSAGEEDQIESLPGEGGGHRSVSGHHPADLLRQAGGAQLPDQFGGGWRVFRRFKGDAVAGGDGADHRRYRQQEGIVPRGDHQADPKGFPQDPAFPGKGGKRRRDPGVGGPAGQLAHSLPQLRQALAGLGHIALRLALPEVGTQGSGDLLLPGADLLPEGLQPSQAHLQRQRRPGGEEAPLFFQRSHQRSLLFAF